MAAGADGRGRSRFHDRRVLLRPARGSDGQKRAPRFRWRYTTDTSAAPVKIDYLYDDRPADLCIFKLDGDTPTLCYSLGDRVRPTKFGQLRTRELVFKRVKSKD